MLVKIKKNIVKIIMFASTISICLLFFNLVNQDDAIIIERLKLYNNHLGDIIDDSGNYLLTTNKKGKPVYNHPHAYNYLLGYSTVEHGSSGLLKTFEKELHDAPRDIHKGATMTTTINAKLQNECYSLLNDLEGSIVVLERNSGKIKTITSNSGNDFKIKELYKDFDNVIHKDNLVDRATQCKEAVGSTFKSVIAALAIENNVQDYIFDDLNGFVKFDNGYTIHNFHNNHYGKTDLTTALNKSSNVYFSSLAVELSRDKIDKLADKLLLNQKIKLDFTTLNSIFDTGFSTSDLAAIGIGQGKLAITPLHLAMIYQGLADGNMYQPYVVEKIERADHKVLYQGETKQLQECFKQNTIKQLDKYLLNNGKYYGFDTKLKIRAKTGTAQITNNRDHTYVASYDDNYVVVASINNAEISSTQLLDTVKKVYEKIYN